jgi:phosphatidylserine decarboxylase
MIENWRIVCHCRMKRHNILLLPLAAVLLSTCVTIVKPGDSIKKLMDKYPNIISVEERWGVWR